MSYDVGIMDGNNMFFKAWAVHKEFSVNVGDKTVYTGGSWGLINSIITFKNEYIKNKKGEVIVTWDRGHDRRTALYPDYKANRVGSMTEEDHDNFVEQIKMAQFLLYHLGIRQAYKDGEEADDIVGTLSRARRDKGLKVLIMSADKDFQQLLDHNIDLLAHKGKDNITLWKDHTWEEEKGIHPSLFAIVLGLMGDAGDNIPGVTGIGEKGAYKLLIENFDLVNAILNEKPHEQFIPAKQSAAIKKLLDQQDQFRLSHTLAKIDRHVKGIKLKIGKKDMDRIEDLFEMYQFHSFLKGSNWKTLEVI
jgi:DNA polymerase-1